MESNMVPINISGILMTNISEVDPWRGVYSNIKMVQMLTAILSILGGVSIISTSLSQFGLKHPEARSFFSLNVSHFFLALCWLVSAVFYKKSHCSRNAACYNLQIVGQILYLSTFLYTLNYMCQMCRSLRRSLDNDLDQMSRIERHTGRAAIILSSLLPVCLAVPKMYFGNSNGCYGNSTHPHSCLVVNVGSLITIDRESYTNESCKQIHLYTTSVFLVMFFLTTISMLVLLGYVHCFLRSRCITDEHRTVVTLTKWHLPLFMIIFFLSSVSAVVLAFRKLVNHEGKNETDLILYHFQSFTAVSQGFMSALEFWCTRWMLRCLKQNSCHDVETQTLLMRSQKKNYASTQTTTTYESQPQRISVLNRIRNSEEVSI